MAVQDITSAYLLNTYCGKIIILQMQISLPYAGLIREATELFGYARLGTNVESAMVSGIKYAVDKGFVAVDGERAVGE